LDRSTTELTNADEVIVQRSDPFVLEPSQVRLEAPGEPGFKIEFKVLASDTAGQFTLLEWALDPWQLGPGLHSHNFDETFYVLSGMVEFQVRDDRYVLGPKQVAWMPRNTPHSFSNAGPELATGLNVSAPGGLERIFAAHAAGEPIPTEFGVAFHGPPVGSDRAPRNPSQV
jgi:quercetin dioxygenase-like cupin family protein